MAEVDKETFDVSREALGIEQDTGEANTVAKVVKGEVVQTKKNKVQKVAETFFGGDLRSIICRQRCHNSGCQGHAL